MEGARAGKRAGIRCAASRDSRALPGRHVPACAASGRARHPSLRQRRGSRSARGRPRRHAGRAAGARRPRARARAAGRPRGDARGHRRLGARSKPARHRVPHPSQGRAHRLGPQRRDGAPGRRWFGDLGRHRDRHHDAQGDGERAKGAHRGAAHGQPGQHPDRQRAGQRQPRAGGAGRRPRHDQGGVRGPSSTMCGAKARS